MQSAAIANRLVPHGTCAVAVCSYEGAGDGQMLVWWELRFLLSYTPLQAQSRGAIQHGWLCVQCGRLADDVWCGNPQDL